MPVARKKTIYISFDTAVDSLTGEDSKTSGGVGRGRKISISLYFRVSRAAGSSFCPLTLIPLMRRVEFSLFQFLGMRSGRRIASKIPLHTLRREKDLPSFGKEGPNCRDQYAHRMAIFSGLSILSPYVWTRNIRSLKNGHALLSKMCLPLRSDTGSRTSTIFPFLVDTVLFWYGVLPTERE